MSVIINIKADVKQLPHRVRAVGRCPKTNEITLTLYSVIRHHAIRGCNRTNAEFSSRESGAFFGQSWFEHNMISRCWSRPMSLLCQDVVVFERSHHVLINKKLRTTSNTLLHRNETNQWCHRERWGYKVEVEPGYPDFLWVDGRLGRWYAIFRIDPILHYWTHVIFNNDRKYFTFWDDLLYRTVRGHSTSGGTRRGSVPGFIPSFGIASDNSTSGSSGIIPRVWLLFRETGVSSGNGVKGAMNKRVLLGSIFSIEDKHSLREPALWGGATHLGLMRPI